jgi:uncharacterized membrane protein YraQ (UPF0718 family)
MKISSEEIKKASKKTWLNFKRVIPVILGVFLLISFLNALIPEKLYSKLFSGIPVLDALIGAIVGSISAGHPLTSYVIGGEFLDQGVAFIAVIAFLLSWVTVGIIQLPAESFILGKKFAAVRNITAFISAIVIAILVVLTLGII